MDKEILLKWAATYGENWEDVRAGMYGWELMIEFAKFYQEETHEKSVSKESRIKIAIVGAKELSKEAIKAARKFNKDIVLLNNAGIKAKEAGESLIKAAESFKKVSKPNLKSIGSLYHK